MTQMLLNTKNPMTTRILLFLNRHNFHFLRRCWGIFLGCDVSSNLPETCIMPHPYGIIVHSTAVLGKNVVIMQQVTIGARKLDNLSPVIGDEVFIGAGAKVLGGIHVGSESIIGANAVITKDVPAGSTVVGHNQIIQPHET